MPSLTPGYTADAYMRVASMAVGAYELICTVPEEYRFYRQQFRRRSLSRQCALFILIRYLSVVVVTVSNVGFFGRFSSLEACRRFMLVSPVFKSLQSMVSQLILGFRTYSISRKSPWVFWAVMTTFALTVPVGFFSNLHGRTPVHDQELHNCTSGNADALRIAWVHYLVAMLFDLVAVCISTGYLWVYSTTASRMSHFVKVLFYEGLGYFIILTGVNVLNLILYLKEGEATQSIGASLGYVVIFIMSQRILLTTRKYAEKYATASRPGDSSCEVPISRRLDTTREINEALRSQFETGFAEPLGGCYSTHRSWREPLCPSGSSEKRADFETSAVDHDRKDAEHTSERARSSKETDSALDVQVRIERTVSVQRVPTAVALGRENYRKPRVMWAR